MEEVFDVAYPSSCLMVLTSQMKHKNQMMPSVTEARAQHQLAYSCLEHRDQSEGTLQIPDKIEWNSQELPKHEHAPCHPYTDRGHRKNKLIDGEEHRALQDILKGPFLATFPVCAHPKENIFTNKHLRAVLSLPQERLW